MNCGYGEKLILYFYGEADAGLKAGVEAHLGTCADCREELDALRLAAGRLDVFPAGPRQAVLEAVLRAARTARRGFVFGWREALFSGALASVLAGVFALSAWPARTDLAWNSGLDSGLDSVEYSVYQEQPEAASAGDWDYSLSDLEAEGLGAAENV
jgi:predicted anti-sigma-YlaC factor YlaD